MKYSRPLLRAACEVILEHISIQHIVTANISTPSRESNTAPCDSTLLLPLMFVNHVASAFMNVYETVFTYILTVKIIFLCQNYY